MDKFEQYLEAQIEACKRQKAGRGAWNYEHGVLLGSQETLEQALIEYRKHKQDAPAFKVGDRVKLKDWDNYVAEIMAVAYELRWEGQEDIAPMSYYANKLEPIEDKIEK